MQMLTSLAILTHQCVMPSNIGPGAGGDQSWTISLRFKLSANTTRGLCNARNHGQSVARGSLLGALCPSSRKGLYHVRDHEGDRLTLQDPKMQVENLKKILRKHGIMDEQAIEIINRHAHCYGKPIFKAILVGCCPIYLASNVAIITFVRSNASTRPRLG